MKSEKKNILNSFVFSNYKWIIQTVSLLFVCFLIVGCTSFSNVENKTNPTVTNPASNIDSIYLTKDSTQHIVSIQIPNVPRLSSTESALIEQFLFRKTKEFCGANIELQKTTSDIAHKNPQRAEQYLTLTSKITYRSHDLVSICFEGMYNEKKAAHPIHVFFSLNYNPQTGGIVKFTEQYAINEELYKQFSKIAENYIREQSGGDWPDGWQSFSEEFCSQEEFFIGLQNETSFWWYQTESTVGIAFAVPYAVGDYLKIEIPNTAIQSGDEETRGRFSCLLP